jgi:hypothetical protein
MIFAKPVDIVPMDLDRDWPEIDRLFDQEEWPILRSDLEVSQAQPKAVALVARSGDTVHGFFVAHHFGDIGYLDMTIVDSRSRVSNVARQLYLKTVRELKEKGIQALVAHSTNDSYRVFKFLRFRLGQSFTLLGRDPVEASPDLASDIIELIDKDLGEIVNLDETIFGMRRVNWIKALLKQPSSRFFGQRRPRDLVASVCLRQRRQDALCLDAANAHEFTDLQRLVSGVLAQFANHRIECFAKTDSLLHHFLLDQEFSVPEFFEPIGPLVEWRKGNVGDIGTSALVQSLSWF